MKTYYQDQFITLYCGDNREVLPNIEPVDLVVTSPPYDIPPHSILFVFMAPPLPELAIDHIKTWSNEGDHIVDPFGGSGTVARVARALGRKCTIIEVNEEYCRLMAERFCQTIELHFPHPTPNTTV